MHRLRRFPWLAFNLHNKCKGTASRQMFRQCSSANAAIKSDRDTSFGFQTVKESEKSEKGMKNDSLLLLLVMHLYSGFLFKLFVVHKVFRDVASSYDLMNDAMSMGIHRVWKDIFIERLSPTHGTKLLDMAGGTGDIAFRYLKYLQNLPIVENAKQSHVTISDINENMLGVGKERAEKYNYTSSALRNCTVDWACADAEKLPFADETFTAYTIAFGIRNCTHIDKVRTIYQNTAIRGILDASNMLFQYSNRFSKKRIEFCNLADDLCA